MMSIDTVAPGLQPLAGTERGKQLKGLARGGRGGGGGGGMWPRI